MALAHSVLREEFSGGEGVIRSNSGSWYHFRWWSRRVWLYNPVPAQNKKAVLRACLFSTLLALISLAPMALPAWVDFCGAQGGLFTYSGDRTEMYLTATADCVDMSYRETWLCSGFCAVSSTLFYAGETFVGLGIGAIINLIASVWVSLSFMGFCSNYKIGLKSSTAIFPDSACYVGSGSGDIWRTTGASKDAGRRHSS